MSPGQVVCLQIYVADNCLGCATALQLGAELQREFPTALIEFVDLREPAPRRRPDVFATPTYVLDDRIVSLGNPDPLQIRTLLREALTASAV